ncbi:MAG: amino acid permease [Chloroflexi bacterium]|nr:amino acid permease [Chloroflexota bacterium]
MERTLFARKATGLVRELGLGAAIIIALANTIGLGWQKRVFQAGGANAVPSNQWALPLHPMTTTFILVGIVVVISAYAYAILSAAMPRSGGGYVFISRLISPPVAVIASLLEFLSIAVSYGLIAVATFEAILIFGGLPGPDALLEVAVGLATPWPMTIIGIVIVAIFSYIAVLGTRLLWQVLSVIFWIPVAVFLFVFLAFLTATPQSMENGVVALTGFTATDYTNAALAQGMAPRTDYWGAVFGSMAFAYWAFIGYAAASFVAGEVKEAGRNLPRAILTAGILITLIYVFISFFLANAGALAGAVTDSAGNRWTFIDAVAFFRHGGGSYGDAGLPSVGGWMPIFAAISGLGGGFILLPVQLFNWGILLFGMLWVANDIPPFILTSSRLIFAMGFDRILPESLAEVNERYHTPVNAIVAASIAALIGVFAEADLFGSAGLGLQGTPIQALISSSGAITATDLFDILFFAGMGLACAYLPTRKPEIFARAPFKASASTVQLVGWAAFLLNLFVGAVLIFHPNAWAFPAAYTDLYSLIFSGPMVTLWLIILFYLVYLWGQNRAKSMGADLTTIYAEIPPE